MYRVLLAVTSAVLVYACAMVPPPSGPQYDESKPRGTCLAKPLSPQEFNQADPSHKPRDLWAVQLIRNPVSDPNQRAVARGDYAARIRIWVTYPGEKKFEGNQDELRTLNAGPKDVYVPVRTFKQVIAVTVDKCEAFAALKEHT
jgi:hypothetical protein